MKINTNHPKGRLITNIHVDLKDAAQLLIQAYSFALRENNMNGKIMKYKDAYDYKYDQIYSHMAIVLQGNNDLDLSKLHRSARKHASYKKALELF